MAKLKNNRSATQFPFSKKDKDDKKNSDKKSAEETITLPMLREYGNKKYRDDAEFKELVNRKYESLKREQQQTAFIVNTQPSLRVMGDLEGEGGNVAARFNGAMASQKKSDSLYENPMLQDYINRVGQALVPTNSRKLYAFRILQDPLPRAESLSTGTIYISTGLLGMLVNEAQLAYVLSHEIAHVEKEHWLPKVMLPIALAEYNEEKAQEVAEENKRKARKRFLISVLSAGAGAGIGAATSGAFGAYAFGNLAYNLSDDIAGRLVRDLVPNNITITEWDTVDEDEADKFAFETCLTNNYDVQEVPKLYTVVKVATNADPRVGLGFIGSPKRVGERVSAAERQLNENKTRIRELSDKGMLIGSRSDFEVLIAEVKRDNGVIAFYYDMFSMARSNLEWSLRVRSDDAKAHYYYGRVIKITARSPQEKERALAEFSTARKLDLQRGSLPGIRLQLAIGLMDLRNSSKNIEIVEHLKEYIRLFKLNNGGNVPPNMDILYDYMAQVGDKTWFAAPATNISTQDVSPVAVKSQNISDNNLPTKESLPVNNPRKK